jgi:hypothetical protein
MFFKKNTINRKLKKSVAIYISDSRGQIIIAPQYVNNAGIRYEQETCTVLNFPIDFLQLGEETLRNFSMFDLKDKNLRDQKRTDWPAFKYSKMKSVKSFEEAFKMVAISGNNESNIIISIETPIVADNDLNIRSWVSTTVSKEEIGKRIIKVYQKANSIL